MEEAEDEQSQPLFRHQPPPSKKLSLLPLVFLIYFEVAGGPYGEEATVGAAGPFFALLGFLLFPFIWSVPEALITAELAAAFPGNGGFVIWAHKAFGPFWGSLMASWKLFTAVINLASFPVLCIDYLVLAFPIFSSGAPRYLAILASTLFLSLLNYIGLTIVGYTAISLGIFTLSPFVVLCVVSIPKIDPTRWVSLGESGVKKDWTLFFNTLFWNLNFWDNASALAGEVENPQQNFPKALLYAGLLCCLGYFIPLLAATGAIPLDQQQWYDGSFAEIAELIAGKWLKIWVEIGAVCSVVGLYEAQLSSCAYQVVGMADLGVLPKVFGIRSVRFNTPWFGILIPTLITLAVGCMDFDNIIYTVNYLYSLGMLLEFASFLWLRRKFGEAKRPFRVPLELPWLVVMCLVPSVFLVYVMAVSTRTVCIISLVLTFVGVAWYFLMNLCRSRMWFEFNNVGGEDDSGNYLD